MEKKKQSFSEIHSRITHKIERYVAVILEWVILSVIILTLIRLIYYLVTNIIDLDSSLTDFKTYQIIFGMVLTVLIAFEFKNSISFEKENLIQVRNVLLIVILALSRKFIILDFKESGIFVVSGITLALISTGFLYWIIGRK